MANELRVPIILVEPGVEESERPRHEFLAHLHLALSALRQQAAAAFQVAARHYEFASSSGALVQGDFVEDLDVAGFPLVMRRSVAPVSRKKSEQITELQGEAERQQAINAAREALLLQEKFFLRSSGDSSVPLVYGTVVDKFDAPRALGNTRKGHLVVEQQHKFVSRPAVFASTCDGYEFPFIEYDVVTTLRRDFSGEWRYVHSDLLGLQQLYDSRKIREIFRWLIRRADHAHA
jgi:hypothetical protein